ncbi:MAG: nucleotide exchange factor GrpE [Bacilli bacterium]|nr:nucleotide exchange factor GrpE [Bacilli bacterium]
MEEEVKVTKKEKKSKEKELIEALTLKVKELEDKNLRVTSEMINSNRRKDEECNRLMKYKNEDMIMDLLQVVDNFERALSVKSTDENYQKGFDMIYAGLRSVLDKYEVKEIECLGLEFDPSLHQAVLTDHVEGKKDNEIIEVMQKGYTYKDKVIRPAMVKVNK